MTHTADEPEQTKDTATRILEAADELFGQRGYDAVSVRDIAEHAGVNKALVFYHHNSKDELFEKVLEGYYEAHRAALGAAAQLRGGTRERMHRIIDIYIDFIFEHQRYPRLVQNLLSGQAQHVQFIQQAMAPLVHWTQQILEGVAPESGPLSARHFFMTISGAVINYFTYAPAVAPVWGFDPLSEQGFEERRAHLHWIVDAFFEKLQRHNEADADAEVQR